MVEYLDTYTNCTIFPQYIIISCWKHNWSLHHLMSSPTWWNWSAEKILSFLIAVRLQVCSITVLIAPSIICDRWSESFSLNSFQYISPEMQSSSEYYSSFESIHWKEWTVFCMDDVVVWCEDYQEIPGRPWESLLQRAFAWVVESCRLERWNVEYWSGAPLHWFLSVFSVTHS